MLGRQTGTIEKYSEYFSNRPKTVFLIVLLVLLVISTTLTVSYFRKTVSVTVDGKTNKVVTYRGNVKDLLKDINVKLDSDDKVVPSLESSISENTTIKIKRAVDVAIVVDGKTLQLKSAEDDVNGLLSSNAFKDLFQKENIGALRETDKISIPLEDKLSADLNIGVTRVDTKVETTTEPIDFASLTTKDETKPMDYQDVVQSGENGEKEVSTMVVLEDGKEVSRQVVSEKVVKEPVNQVLSVGTLGVFVPSRGTNEPYSRHIKMRATAYSAEQPDITQYTATGARVKRDSGGYSTIAVDPRIIPLGTRMYIPGYGYAIAADTGGAINGDTIDIYFDTISECQSWGVKWVDVYILE